MTTRAPCPAKPCMLVAPPPLSPATRTLDLGSQKPLLPRPPLLPRQSSLRVGVPLSHSVSVQPALCLALMQFYQLRVSTSLFPTPSSPLLPRFRGGRPTERHRHQSLQAPQALPRKVQGAMGAPGSSLGISRKRVWYILASITGPCSQRVPVSQGMRPSSGVLVLFIHPPVDSCYNHNNKKTVTGNIHLINTTSSL